MRSWIWLGAALVMAGAGSGCADAKRSDGGDADASISMDDLAAGSQPDAAVDAGPPLDPASYHARADAALETLLLGYWSQSLGYFAADSTRTAATGYWTFAQAWDAVLDGA